MRDLKLRPHELQMVSMLAAGKRQAEMARHFAVTEAAVSKWMQALRLYAQARTNEELMAIVMRQGILH